MMKRTLLLLAAAMLCLAGCTEQLNPQNSDQNGGQNNGGNTDDPNQGGVQPDFTPEAWYQTNYWERTDREKMGLRGPVKKWKLKGRNGYTWEFDQAGRLTSLRYTNTDSPKDQLYVFEYDEQGRLVKQTEARVEKGATELPPMPTLEDWSGNSREITEYEYNNTGKYVLVDVTINGFRSDLWCQNNEVTRDYRNTLGAIRKDLSLIREYNYSFDYDDISYLERAYVFGGDGSLVVKNTTYIAPVVKEIEWHDAVDDQGNPLLDGEGQPMQWGEYKNIYIGEKVLDSTSEEEPIVYKNGYPYSRTSAHFPDYDVTSATWNELGMPVRIEGAEGITEFFPGPRYLAIQKWNPQPGKYRDIFWGGAYWDEYTIDENEAFVSFRQNLGPREEGAEDRIREFAWHDYVYDAHGNWTKVVYDSEAVISFGTDEKSTTTLETEIEYW